MSDKAFGVCFWLIINTLPATMICIGYIANDADGLGAIIVGVLVQILVTSVSIAVAVELLLERTNGPQANGSENQP